MEGINKKLSLFGNYVDIFKGIPFAAPPKALENPQRHPGWQGGRGWMLGRPCGWGWLVGGAAILKPAPPVTHRDPEGQGLQEAMSAGHCHSGQHLRGGGLSLPQHLGPPGQEGRSARPPAPSSSPLAAGKPQAARVPSPAPGWCLGPQS